MISKGRELKELLHSGLLPERKGQPFQEHWQILRALQASEGQLAESLMRAHIGRANELLITYAPVGDTSAQR